MMATPLEKLELIKKELNQLRAENERLGELASVRGELIEQITRLEKENLEMAEAGIDLLYAINSYFAGRKVVNFDEAVARAEMVFGLEE